MKTPFSALLWEIWRLTYRQFALWTVIIVVVGAVIGFGVGVQFQERKDYLATLFFTFIAALVPLLVLRTKIIDDRMGFPFYLGYTRPVSTVLLVVVPILSLGFLSALSYLVSIGFLTIVLGLPIPLMPAAMSIAAVSILMSACQWWTSNRSFRVLGWVIVVFGSAIFLSFQLDSAYVIASEQEAWSNLIVFSWYDYAMLLLASVVAIFLTILGVENQRHGGGGVNTDTGEDYSSRKIRLSLYKKRIRVPYPTSSPLRAQVWFEMRSKGVFILAPGLIIALGTPAFLLGLNSLGLGSGFFLILISFVWLLFRAAASVFGIERKQGKSYFSIFVGVRALGTASLAWVSLSVSLFCVISAWIAVGASLWLSSPLIASAPELSGTMQDIGNLLSIGLRILNNVAESLPILWLPVETIVQLSVVVATFATVQVLFITNAKRLIATIAVLATYAILFAIGVLNKWIETFYITAHLWVLASLVPILTIYLLLKLLATNVLSLRQAVIIVSIWLGYLTVNLSLLQGWQMFYYQPSKATMAVFFGFLPLGAVLLPPWALTMLRHR